MAGKPRVREKLKGRKIMPKSKKWGERKRKLRWEAKKGRKVPRWGMSEETYQIEMENKKEIEGE